MIMGNDNLLKKIFSNSFNDNKYNLNFNKKKRMI